MEKKIVIILCVLDVILLGFSIFLYVGEDRTPPAIAFGGSRRSVSIICRIFSMPDAPSNPKFRTLLRYMP